MKPCPREWCIFTVSSALHTPPGHPFGAFSCINSRPGGCGRVQLVRREFRLQKQKLISSHFVASQTTFRQGGGGANGAGEYGSWGNSEEDRGWEVRRTLAIWKFQTLTRYPFLSFGELFINFLTGFFPPSLSRWIKWLYLAIFRSSVLFMSYG